MIELAYTSTTTRSYTAEDLKDILTTSRANNAKAGITGILLYRRSTVMQLLEGEPEAVHALYAKLQLDPRHHSLVLLYDRPIAQRAFGQWTMGFEDWTEEGAFGEGVHRMTRLALEPEVNVPPGQRRLVDAFLRLVN